MKVLHDLSRYLLQEGYVSHEMYFALQEQGFAPEDGEHEYDGSWDAEPEDPTENVPHRLRFPSKPSPKLPSMTVTSLRQRIGERIPSWSVLDTLEQLVALMPHGLTSRQRGREKRVEAACAALRLASRDERVEAVAEAIRRRSPDLDALCELAGFRGYREVLDASDARGRVVNAYVAALASVGKGDVGAYGWVLKFPQIRIVFHLVEAQQVVARSLGDLLDVHPELLPTALRRAPRAYWPFVLVHSARLFDPDRPFHLPGRGRHHPRRLEPNRTDWAHAWALATTMDDTHVRRFLVYLAWSQHWDGPAPTPRFSQDRRGDLGILGGAMSTGKMTPFACPSSWDGVSGRAGK